MLVGDIDRAAAVIQAVMKDGDTIYGSLFNSCLKIFSLYAVSMLIIGFAPIAASDSRKNGIAAGY